MSDDKEKVTEEPEQPKEEKQPGEKLEVEELDDVVGGVSAEVPGEGTKSHGH